MEFYLIGWVNRIGGPVFVYKNIEVANAKEAKTAAEKIKKELRKYPTHKSESLRLFKPICTFGKSKEAFFQSIFGRPK